ncbi:MAG: hypothetical protein J7513_00685 [Solirubrobacteraceae bacterium]|nr:hypothetical protein [Solirubrobacteraceae bacterium]
MHAKLRTAITAAAIVTAVPAASIASAHEGMGGGKGQSGAKGHHGGKGHGKPGKRCDRGRGYEAQGRLADGSELVQVAGADTDRRGDDRFSGTLVVEVKQGNRRGRADVGLTSYAVDQIRALGTASGDDPLPAVGTRVLLVGTIANAACPTPKPSPSPDPTATPAPSSDDDPTDYPTATRASVTDDAESDDPASWDGGGDDASSRGDDRSEDDAGDDRGNGGPRGKGGDDSPSSDYPSSDDPDATSPTTPEAATASAASIKLVVFKNGKRWHR